MHIVRENIDPEADKVVRRLARHGYKAYLVGGCVRDLLLGRKPKDFDVATSATPKDIKQLFRNCRIIGRRFRLAHIFFGQKIIETSTFRANPRQGEEEENEEILIRRDNVFGSETEDAQRRDFTMNGLFYDVEEEQVIDHVGGLADLEARLVSTIGDPDIRFREDPVRILRAIKFAARLDFAIEPTTLAAAIRHRGEIAKCAPPRVLEEVYRFLRGGAARRSIELLCETGTAGVLSRQLADLYSGAPEPTADLEGTADLHAADPHAAVTDEADEADEAAWSEPRLMPTRHALDADEATWAAVWANEGPIVADHDDRRVAAAPVAPALAQSEATHVGDRSSLDERRAFAFRALDQLDVLFAEGIETSNALLTAVLATPFLYDELMQPGLRPVEANDLVEGLLGPLVTQLQVARKDAERARQILLVQRRMAPGRRKKPTGSRRELVDDAQLLSDIMAASRGEGSAEGPYWERLREAATDVDDTDEAGGKRRRRRRGGRRRRRGGDEDVADAGSDEAAENLTAADGAEPVSA